MPPQDPGQGQVAGAQGVAATPLQAEFDALLGVGQRAVQVIPFVIQIGQRRDRTGGKRQGPSRRVACQADRFLGSAPRLAQVPLLGLYARQGVQRRRGDVHIPTPLPYVACLAKRLARRNPVATEHVSAAQNKMHHSPNAEILLVEQFEGKIGQFDTMRGVALLCGEVGPDGGDVAR